jgi:hypothetical protein
MSERHSVPWDLSEIRGWLVSHLENVSQHALGQAYARHVYPKISG